MYNIVHGVNPLAGITLTMLGVTATSQIPRFRDAYFDGEHLCIYTRTGGGNRDTYENAMRAREWYEVNYPEGLNDLSGPFNEDLRKLPGYVRDADDDFDSTYATFYYEIPKQFPWFKEWANDKTAKPASERWAEALEKLRTAAPDDPMVRRLSKALGPLVDFLKEGTK
jgi:hypothetical protein